MERMKKIEEGLCKGEDKVDQTEAAKVAEETMRIHNLDTNKPQDSELARGSAIQTQEE